MVEGARMRKTRNTRLENLWGRRRTTTTTRHADCALCATNGFDVTRVFSQGMEVHRERNGPGKLGAGIGWPTSDAANIFVLFCLKLSFSVSVSPVPVSMSV